MKVKASKSPWLRTLFLANLTLFLDSSHFNQSEWDRLEHFAPPFGFMELNYSCESSGGGGGEGLGPQHTAAALCLWPASSLEAASPGRNDGLPPGPSGD